MTHALTFGITAVLVSALLLSAGSFLDTREEQVSESYFSDIGSDVVSHINSFDRLNETGENVEASIEPDYPDDVVGESYTVQIADSDNPFGTDFVLEIRSDRFATPLQYPIRNDTSVDVGASARSDDLVICLQDDKISLGGGCL